MMLTKYTHYLRGVQAVASVTVLGLTAYVINWWSHYWRDMSPTEFNFLLAASVWSTVAVAYQGAVLHPMFSRMHNRFLVLGLDALTMIFWFAGFVGLAAFLAARVCFGNVCNVAKASVAVAAVEWLLFAATTTNAALFTFRRNRVQAHPKGVDLPTSGPA